MDDLYEAREIVRDLPDKKKAKLLYGDGFWNVHSFKGTRVIPVGMHDGPLGLRIPVDGEAKNRPAICYPSPALLACSFSEPVMNKVGTMMGREALEQGTDMVLAPGINIKRNPLCGRNFEYLSEDPLVSGKMASYFIRGIQSTGVGSTVKHFMGNNQEYRRFTYSAEIDDRALNEIYLRPFEIAVKEGKPWAVMSSYNRVNGVQMSSNGELVKGILKEKWGFNGPVMSDWSATVDPVGDHAQGLDLEMPGPDKKRWKKILKGIEEGKLTKEDLDECAARVVTLSVQKRKRQEHPHAWNLGMARSVAKGAAEQSIVLAKNEKDFLPFKNYNQTCVIGALADELRYQGAGSSQVTAIDPKSFRKAVQGDIPYARGYACGNDDLDNYVLKSEAVKLAEKYRKIILFLGLPPAYESEGFDRTDMKLPDEQLELWKAVLEVNQNVVLVVLAGGPVELPYASSTRAIILPYLSGEAGMEALDSIIIGKVNPSGRLAETWPLSYTDVPSSSYYPGNYDTSYYKESIFVGYRYYETANEPVLFPFGHGLSYSKLKYSKLTLSNKELKPREKLEVSLEITNQSNINCRETVLLFVSKKANSQARPKRELKAFTKVIVKAGETKKVNMEISYDDFRFYFVPESKFVCEGGVFNVEICKNAGKTLLSSSIKVVEDEKVPSQTKAAKPYLDFVKTGVLDVSDEEFAAYRGKLLSDDKAKEGFDQNSSFYEIRETWIGKILLNALRKHVTPKEDLKKGVDTEFYLMAIHQPLRTLLMEGYPDRLLHAVVEWANGNFWKGVGKYLGKH